jgi:DNA-binding transcriptional ArsR family regulator
LPEDALELDTRRRIVAHVQRHPGTHMRELQRQLGMSLGTLEYHLHVLVRAGLLSSREDGRYVRYYVEALVGRREKDLLGLLRQEVPRRVCAQLLLRPEQSHKELLSHFRLAPSTLTFHLKKLLAARVVDAWKHGRETRYRVLEPDLVAKCLLAYRGSFLDDVVDRFAEAWLDVGASLEPAGEEQPGSGGSGGAGEAPAPAADPEDEPKGAPEEPPDKAAPGPRPGRLADVLAMLGGCVQRCFLRTRRPVPAAATNSTAPSAPASTLGGSSPSAPCTSNT